LVLSSESLTSSTQSILVSVKVRKWFSGEQLKGSGACKKWTKPSYYLLEEPGEEVTEWLPCQDNFLCLGGNEIYPKADYWRSSNQTDEFELWYADEACL
jgi:hypothetical protein